MNTEIIPYATINQMVQDYQEGIKRVSAAYELLSQAEPLLKSIASYPHVMPDDRYLPDWAAERVLKSLKKSAWSGVLLKTQAQKFMTNSRYEKFERSLEKPDDLPEITIQTVQDFVQNLITSAPDMILEFITETFNWLRPGSYSLNNYKTNQKSEYEIQEKIIKSWMFDAWYKPPRLNHSSAQPLKAMDSAFHLMDGKGIPKDESSATSAIEIARQENKQTAETEYFRFKWYKNGNCHIQFKRMDLVVKMNQIAGEGLLKPE